LSKIKWLAYRTVWEHFRTGKIPGAYKFQTGTIVIPDTVQLQQEFTVVYARVSSSENRQNCVTQAERVSQFCSARGWQAQNEKGDRKTYQELKLCRFLKPTNIEFIRLKTRKSCLTRLSVVVGWSGMLALKRLTLQLP